MQTRPDVTTVTFTRAFQLGGLKAVLPAGVYSVEAETQENAALSGISLPNRVPASVLIHLHSTLDTPGQLQTVSVPRAALDAALARDRLPALASPQPSLNDMLVDPTIRLVMASDGVSEASIRDMILQLPKR